jgi:hydrogenase expression/formation protein HypE
MNEKIKMNLQCPMPKFDFDVITLGHGSGGLLTHRLLQSGVFDILKTICWINNTMGQVLS